MRLTKCSKNHFYDGDKYSECPHCSRTASAEQAGPDERTPSVPPAFHKTTSKLQTSQEISQTSSLRGDSRLGRVGNTGPVLPEVDVTMTLAESQTDAQIPLERAASAVPADGKRNDSPRPAGFLQAAVDSVKSPISSEDTKTMAFYNIAAEEPVVGWLVCIKGEYFGESFNLKTGRNMIGRSLKMDVSLAKEPSVSRDRHAILTFEPKKRKFYIQPGEGSGLTYVNDDLLMVPCELKSYDRVQIGNSEFVFCAFCGESFTWDDYV